MDNSQKRRVVWFSCGAASAVAAKRAVQKFPNVEVVYCDTMSTEHEDNYRFFNDVQRWIGKPITVIRSGKYNDINHVFQDVRYLSGPKGARCTVEMKKIPRELFQRHDDIHVFGYTSDKSEQTRAERFEKANPALHVEWILIDEEITKDDCLASLESAGIALPAMYGLGFDHNNCKGCVKSQSPGYWNRTRRNFPEVFALRAQQSRLLGVKLVVLGEERTPEGKRRSIRCSLDDLDPLLDAPDDDIDCGPVCQVPSGSVQP